MAHVIPFEICGLHYVLGCSDDPSAPGLQFRLRDESFSSPVKTFSAWSFEDLFSKVEEHIGLPLAFDLRRVLARAGRDGRGVRQLDWRHGGCAWQARDGAVPDSDQQDRNWHALNGGFVTLRLTRRIPWFRWLSTPHAPLHFLEKLIELKFHGPE